MLYVKQRKRTPNTQPAKQIASRSWFNPLYNWPPNCELLLNSSLLELIFFLKVIFIALKQGFIVTRGV